VCVCVCVCMHTCACAHMRVCPCAWDTRRSHLRTQAAAHCPLLLPPFSRPVPAALSVAGSGRCVVVIAGGPAPSPHLAHTHPAASVQTACRPCSGCHVPCRPRTRHACAPHPCAHTWQCEPSPHTPQGKRAAPAAGATPRADHARGTPAPPTHARTPGDGCAALQPLGHPIAHPLPHPRHPNHDGRLQPACGHARVGGSMWADSQREGSLAGFSLRRVGSSMWTASQREGSLDGFSRCVGSARQAAWALCEGTGGKPTARRCTGGRQSCSACLQPPSAQAVDAGLEPPLRREVSRSAVCQAHTSREGQPSQLSHSTPTGMHAPTLQHRPASGPHAPACTDSKR